MRVASSRLPIPLFLRFPHTAKPVPHRIQRTKTEWLIRLREAIPEVLENANENLTPRMRRLVAMLWCEWKDLERQILEMNDEVERIASSDAACVRSQASDR